MIDQGRDEAGSYETMEGHFGAEAREQMIRDEVALGTLCPCCKEDRETQCRCGWTPGLCISCATNEALEDGRCVTNEALEDGRCVSCFAPDGSENQAF